MAKRPPHPVGPSIVQAVRLVDRYSCAKGHRYVATSLPGHLIQCFVTGTVRQEMNGRSYEIGPGHVVWYHEDELVRGEVLTGPWSFYTLNVIAPTLSPPPFEKRVWKAPTSTARAFQYLLDAWRNQNVSPSIRELLVQARTSELLVTLIGGAGAPLIANPSAKLWWDLETRLREDLSQPMSLGRMQSLTGKSIATLTRSSIDAVGLPPMKRMKQVRLSFARGLVQHSDLMLKEIAGRVGYARVHEFSRDYRKHFGTTARDDRG